MLKEFRTKVGKGFRFVKETFFTDKLWTLNTELASKAWKRLVLYIKLARITLEKFSGQRLGFQCLGLSYYTMMAIIPLIAFIFFLSDGLQIADKVNELLVAALPNNLDFVNMAMDKAGNIIEIAQAGPVGWISAGVFIWTIIWLMYQVECVFNNVWGIKKVPRKLYKRFLFYIGLLFLLPFAIVIMSFGIVTYSGNSFFRSLHLDFLYRFVGWLMLYGVVVFTLSAAYKYIPACKVRYKYALQASLLSGAVFTVFQYLYLETQTFVNRLNTVYGVLAAIPLFLIWLNYSFQIILYGAQFTYALQNVDVYKDDDTPVL